MRTAPSSTDPADPSGTDHGPARTRLKSDLFGTVTRIELNIDGQIETIIERDLGPASWWVRPLARRLAAREALALARLDHVTGVPKLLSWDGRRLERSYLPGQPMQRAAPRDAGYFRAALHLVRQLHAAGVVHNDLAKEPNWLVDPDGCPALVDFQLASRRKRSRFSRMQAHDDLRHLLKHKRTYCPERLTARERRILASPSFASRAWKRTGKPVYLFITRRLLGWADREGAGDRQRLRD